MRRTITGLTTATILAAGLLPPAPARADVGLTAALAGIATIAIVGAAVESSHSHSTHVYVTRPPQKRVHHHYHYRPRHHVHRHHHHRHVHVHRHGKHRH